MPVLGEPGHIAGNFSFTNQEGKLITEKDMVGKVAVIEYFFTSCPGICKVMNKNLNLVYKSFKGRSDFAILSHTVEPETDSVPVLARYARNFNAEAPTWQFLTGNKYDLYKAARTEYLLAIEEENNSAVEEDFIHTQYVALLDKNRRIRGFYDATDRTSVDKLIKDVKTLIDK